MYHLCWETRKYIRQEMTFKMLPNPLHKKGLRAGSLYIHVYNIPILNLRGFALRKVLFATLGCLRYGWHTSTWFCCGSNSGVSVHALDCSPGEGMFLSIWSNEINIVLVNLTQPSTPITDSSSRTLPPTNDRSQLRDNQLIVKRGWSSSWRCWMRLLGSDGLSWQKCS